MATDEELNQGDSDSQEFWSPVHAWRALGQLKAVQALEPILAFQLKAKKKKSVTSSNKRKK